MATLKTDWLTEGWIDFEYKKYTLLAYLQEVNSNFKEARLFPDLPNVQTHYELAAQLKSTKNKMVASFPKNVAGVDLKKKQIVYEKFQENEQLAEIDSILDYSLPLFQQTLTQGQAQYEDIEARLMFAPVGIVPLHLKEGYLFLYRTRRSETDIYRYQLRLFEHQAQRSVQTTYLETVRKGVSMTFENLKLTLIRKRRELPNPATYLVESPADYPVQETLLPIAKRLIVKHIVS
ncbi:hypothetical protein [Runella slithyformis]|uniref:Uncharacterized protein n=1 Tax=Runella slithyformis (strain ATCC 29530 / DSM 19594 / LMG 11500 / NCIMB 11436 / LSU 4) TaxID=761193 RepID=A0A7U4E8E3_RUNSL|nr:hypothetical protein [Runella slithyformis]AEI51164.1 hypothetical protein Runsl_4853 [Runella slithyformis DSM 19594]